MFAAMTMSLTVGCATEPAKPAKPELVAPESVTAADKMISMVSSTPLTPQTPIDQAGLQASVWFLINGQDAAVLVQGRLEVLMFDGVISRDTAAATVPLHMWEFPSDQLPRHAGKHRLWGWGYNLGNMPWGVDIPKQPRVTVIFRYTGGGKTIESDPTVLVVRPTD